MFSGGILTHWINKLNWHEWGLRWAPEEEEERKHMGVFDLVHAMRLGGHSMMKFKVNLTILITSYQGWGSYF